MAAARRPAISAGTLPGRSANGVRPQEGGFEESGAFLQRNGRSRWPGASAAIRGETTTHACMMRGSRLGSGFGTSAARRVGARVRI